jgi:hypothetical protein
LDGVFGELMVAQHGIGAGLHVVAKPCYEDLEGLRVALAGRF